MLSKNLHWSKCLSAPVSCGTGDVIPRNSGFYTIREAGQEFVTITSVYFSAFMIPGSTNYTMTFNCNFIVCSGETVNNCDKVRVITARKYFLGEGNVFIGICMFMGGGGGGVTSYTPWDRLHGR